MKSENKTIQLRDGTSIYTKITYADTPSDIWLVATHGISEHLGRHTYIPELFRANYNIFQYDLRGHGKSGGTAVFIEDFFQYMRDLDEIINYLRKHHSLSRHLLFGHSMGGLIVAGYLQRYAQSDYYPEKVFIHAPPVGLPGIAGKIIKLLPKGLMKLLAKIPMSTRVGGLMDLKYLSHDPTVYDKYVNDDLVYIKLHTKLVLNLAWASKVVFNRPIDPLCPAYCSIGTSDRLVDTEGLIDYFSDMENRFTLKIVDGAYHEIHNETDQYRNPYFTYLKNALSVK